MQNIRIKSVLFCYITWVMVSVLCLMTLQAASSSHRTVPSKKHSFASYWYDHGAEVSHYSVQWRRYGHMRKGRAILIYVTEPFWPEKQVKNDAYQNGNQSQKIPEPSTTSPPIEQPIPILKLNMINRFRTGLYDYSIMQSIFTPIVHVKQPLKSRSLKSPFQASLPNGKTLKVTTSIQDWCGHVFMQHNLKKHVYEVQLFSYFEREADYHSHFSVDKNTVLEEDIWMQVRLFSSQKRLPQGLISVVPSGVYARLKHLLPRDFIPMSARATLQSAVFEGKTCQRYSIRYLKLDREVVWYISTVFPHRILGWEEFVVPVSPSVQEEHKETEATSVLMVRAVRTHVIMRDYWRWNQNTSKAKTMRQRSLGLGHWYE